MEAINYAPKNEGEQDRKDSSRQLSLTSRLRD